MFRCIIALLLLLSPLAQAATWTQSEQDYLNELSRRPAARGPATFLEAFEKNWAAAGLDTITGAGRPLTEAQDELVKAIENASGKSIGDYAFEHGVILASVASPDQRNSLLATLADTLPKEARVSVEPLKDVRRRVAEKEKSIREAALDARYASYGFVAVAPWLAIVTRHAIEPYGWPILILLVVAGLQWRRCVRALLTGLRLLSPGALSKRLVRASANAAVKWEQEKADAKARLGKERAEG